MITGNLDIDQYLLQFLDEKEVVKMEQLSTYWKKQCTQFWKQKVKTYPSHYSNGKQWYVSRYIKKEAQIFPLENKEKKKWKKIENKNKYAHARYRCSKKEYPFLKDGDFVYFPSEKTILKKLCMVYDACSPIIFDYVPFEKKEEWVFIPVDMTNYKASCDIFPMKREISNTLLIEFLRTILKEKKKESFTLYYCNSYGFYFPAETYEIR